MAGTKRLAKSFYRLLLPTVILAFAAIGTASVWLVHEASRPVNNVYLVTPEKYGLLSSRGSQVTDESWQNADDSPARGWLLRGTPNAPAVILLHRYGADRSHLLNLGVKLNESTNFTVLMPDLRGHGENPLVECSSFGGCESDDTGAAINYLRGLRSPEQMPLVGKDIGIYGLEMGALAALSTASADPSVKALVLDSVPRDADGLMSDVIAKRFPFASAVTSKFASLGAYPYYYKGCYRRGSACEAAKSIANRRTLLLAGHDAPDFQDATNKLGKCFPVSTTVDSKTDLSPSGMGMINASIELSEAYDQRVIDFLKQALTLP
jgi:pimeloyl-ACP methyl ester carboxylesterase